MSDQRTPEPDTRTPEELESEAIGNWLRAVEHLSLIRKEWEDRGMPLTDTNPNGIEYVDPLYKMFREAERDVAARLKEIPRPPKQSGRSALGTIRPDKKTSISESPASRRRRMQAVEGGKS